MNRTFHRRPDSPSVALVFAVGLAALCLMARREGPALLLGLVLVGVAVVMMERIIHAVYTFDDADRCLVIRLGRFSRTRRLPVSLITRAIIVPRRAWRMPHVVLEYGAGRVCSVCPDNAGAFVAELTRRQAAAEEAGPVEMESRSIQPNES